jgi:hypothetical protein
MASVQKRLNSLLEIPFKDSINPPLIYNFTSLRHFVEAAFSAAVSVPIFNRHLCLKLSSFSVPVMKARKIAVGLTRMRRCEPVRQSRLAFVAPLAAWLWITKITEMFLKMLNACN